MKKVLFVATVVRTHINEFHLPYIKKFHELGWQVDVAAKNDFIPEDTLVIPYCDNFYDIDFYRNPLSIHNYLAYYKLHSLLQEQCYDLLICNTPVGGVLSRLAARNISGIKVVYIAHGFHFFKGNIWYKNVIFHTIENYVAKYTDCLLTINQEDYEAASKFTLRTKDNVHLINSIGCKLDRFYKGKDKRQIRQKNNIKENAFVVVNVAELIKRKNYPVALKAFAKADIPDSIFMIIGSGADEDKLKKMANKLGIDERVSFMGYRNDVPDLLRAADVLLFPSRHEGLGMAIVEAMAAGLPVLVSDIRGPRDCIVKGKSGFAYNPNDVNGFANGLQCIYKMSDDEKQKIRTFNQEHSKKFSIDDVLTHVFGIYERCGYL